MTGAKTIKITVPFFVKNTKFIRFRSCYFRDTFVTSSLHSCHENYRKRKRSKSTKPFLRWKWKIIVFAPVISVTRLLHLRYIRVTKMTGASSHEFRVFSREKMQKMGSRLLFHYEKIVTFMSRKSQEPRDRFRGFFSWKKLKNFSLRLRFMSRSWQSFRDTPNKKSRPVRKTFPVKMQILLANGSKDGSHGWPPWPDITASPRPLRSRAQKPNGGQQCQCDTNSRWLH